MKFFLLRCFCIIVAIFGFQAVAEQESQSIIVTFYFESTGNCRLSRVAMEDDEYGYDVVEHGQMFSRTYFKRTDRNTVNTCAYKNLLKQTRDPAFLIITTSNETILRGTIRIDNYMYSIENHALEINENNLLVSVQQTTFYVVYENHLALFDNKSGGFQRLTSNNQSKKYAHNGNNVPVHYLELYVGFDEKFCKQLCEDNHRTQNQCPHFCKRKVLDIIKRVHAIFRELSIYLVIVGLDYVAFEDITPNSERFAIDMLRPFQQYVTTNKAHVAYDVAHLISGFAPRHDPNFGSGDFATVCAKHEAFGVTVAYATTDTIKRSIAVANVIARSLNIEFDENGCGCSGPRCIMGVTDFFSHSVLSTWSVCSRAFLNVSLKKAIVYCLKNIPQSIAASYDGICGNGIVDANEQCDNGKLNNDKCCNMENCQFQKNATCASGACCDQNTCQIKPKSSVCSTKKNECDLEEICNGQSEWCPKDQHVADRTPCDNNKGKCYKGHCGSRDLACKMLYNDFAQSGSNACYDENVKNDPKNGFCNITWSAKSLTTVPCSESNKMCGQLQCNVGYGRSSKWPTIKLAQNDALETRRNAFCTRKYFYLRDDIRSPFMVPNGSPCKTNGICVDSVCQVEETTVFTPTDSEILETQNSSAGNNAPEKTQKTILKSALLEKAIPITMSEDAESSSTNDSVSKIMQTIISNTNFFASSILTAIHKTIIEPIKSVYVSIFKNKPM